MSIPSHNMSDSLESNTIFDILNNSKNQIGSTSPVQRKLCLEPCCTIKTRRICRTCGKNNVCKTHGICAICKGIDLPIDIILSPDEQEKADRNRERARNVYRQKMGIPLDAPLIQRGGARNVKYRTPEEKATKKEFDREYQKKYREKHAQNK